MLCNKKLTIGYLITMGIEALKKENIESYILDAQLLLAKAIDKDRLFVMLNRDKVIEENQAQIYKEYIDLRKNKMPIKYILGQCEFMGLNFNVRQGVLIPRPDTEVLVETCLKDIKDKNYKTVADVCCGSGIIGICISSFVKDLNVDCYDIDDIPIEVTSENIKINEVEEKVKVFKSDLLNYAIDNHKKYDIIVSNPPYIKEEVIPTLMEDVKNFEPHLALSGGLDGLFFYRKIIKQSKSVLNDKGTLAFEIGYDQREDVEKILLENGFSNIQSFKDLAGLDRVVKGEYLK